MTLDLMALGPHPDDVEFSCGGWIAAAALKGQRVGIVDLTQGELASNGTVEIRAKEAAAAAEVLGLAFRENLRLPDGGLSGESDTQVAALVGAIRRHRPALLLAPHTEARHPDHAAAGILAHKAMFFAGVKHYRPTLGAPFRPARAISYPQRRELTPSFVVDISHVVEIKERSILCHASQIGGGTQTLVNRPLGIRAFSVRDGYWGAAIGVSHGEPYATWGPLPVSDPIAHFSDHPSLPVLYP